MEVRPGYKRTEVGVIPEEWDVDSLTSVTPKNVRNGIVDGPFGSNLKTIHYRTTGIPIITSGYVTGGEFRADNYLYVEKQKFDEEKRSAVHPGDIVMAKIGARCGASAILPSDHPIGILSGNALKITVDETRHSTGYIWQVLWSLYSEGNVEALRTVGAQPAISMAILKKHKIALPPEPEQRAIAEVLSDVDALLGGLDRLIDKKRDLKQAVMQQLLTGQTRLPGFHAEWEVRRLGDHVRFLRNGVNSRAELLPEGRVKYLHYGDIHACNDSFISPYTLPSLPDAKAARLDRLRDGDVIFADASEDMAGVCKSVELRGAYEAEVVSGLHTIAGRFDKTVLADGFKGFLQYCPSFAAHLRSLAAGTKVYATNRTHIASVEMRLPSVAEQAAIAAVLSDMDAELSALESRRDKTRALKQAMMQELLTGKTRLI